MGRAKKKRVARMKRRIASGKNIRNRNFSYLVIHHEVRLIDLRHPGAPGTAAFTFEKDPLH